MSFIIEEQKYIGVDVYASQFMGEFGEKEKDAFIRRLQALGYTLHFRGKYSAKCNTFCDSCSEHWNCKDSASSVEVCSYHAQLPNLGGDSPHYACYIISERAKPLTIAEAIESIIDPAMQG